MNKKDLNQSIEQIKELLWCASVSSTYIGISTALNDAQKTLQLLIDKVEEYYKSKSKKQYMEV